MSDIPTRCEKCSSLDLTVSLLNVPAPHWGKLICNECKVYIQWIAYPSKERKITVKKNFIKSSDSLCCFCGQQNTEMKNGNFLTADHQLQLNNGGEDSEKNMWLLCDACHKLKNWLMIHGRNKYLETKKGETNNEGDSENIKGLPV